jgi:phosphatidylserine decarboxylase
MMRIDRAGIPFVAGAAGLAAVTAVVAGPVGAALPAILAAFFAFFFRDPDREPPADPCAVLAPADGRVLVAGPAEPDVAPSGTWLQISIFLSPLDVHVNRVPVSGRVGRVEYRPGRFLPAYRRDAAGTNERSEVWIHHGGQVVVVRQVVGILARRVVCRLAPGREVSAGDRLGIMKFGSRMDVFLPTSAVLRVSPGDRVRGGESVVATL